MAERKAKNDIENTNTESNDELNLDTKVTVKNLSNWKVTFARRHDGVGDVVIVENGQYRLSRNEIQAQIDVGNKLFSGIDGMGSHASLYIEDAPTRRFVGFESEGHKQAVINDESVKELFKMSFENFKDELPKRVVTRAEKYYLMKAIDRLGINDYKKIVFASQYTGYKIQ